MAWTESTPANQINDYIVLVNGIADGGGPRLLAVTEHLGQTAIVLEDPGGGEPLDF